MENKKNLKIIIWALAATGQGISGGDRIFIEFAREWSKKYPVTIYVWEEGAQMCKRAHLGISNARPERSRGIKFQISNMELWRRLGFVINYIARIIEGIRIGITLNIDDPQSTIVYSASDFWMDSLPAFVLKLRYLKIRWAAAWYQTAPKPWVGFSEGERKDKYYFRALIYWLVQLPIKNLISNFADFVLVNNEEEKKQFSRLNNLGKAIVVLGAVDLEAIKQFKKLYAKHYPLNPKKYDGVFQGRFHPQKGVLELIDIWRLVVNEKPDAKLVMIGDGPLMEAVMGKVQGEKLGGNIILTGYLFDGEEKYRIFSKSKLVVHPAFYDSGGMASAEAMAFGLPCVGFDLKSFNDYYPEGIQKVKIGDLEAFAKKVLELLHDKNLYKKISQEAMKMINYKWSWEYRARQIITAVLE